MSSLSLLSLFRKFPDEKAAATWLERRIWLDGEERHCLRCGCIGHVHEVRNAKPMPYRCSDCGKYFSLRTGTVMEGSNLPLHKWLVAVHLLLSNPKGISSIRLGEALGVRQKTAWYLAHPIGKSMAEELPDFIGPVEIDETYIGGRQRNKHFNKRKTHAGPLGDKVAVLGVKDRATHCVAAVALGGSPCSHDVASFYTGRIDWSAELYTDESTIYSHCLNRSTVNHSRGQYVDGDIHTNGVESFWALVKRGYMGTYHKWSPKHLPRYLAEFTGRFNSREEEPLERIGAVFDRMRGKRLKYRDLVG